MQCSNISYQDLVFSVFKDDTIQKRTFPAFSRRSYLFSETKQRIPKNSFWTYFKKKKTCQNFAKLKEKSLVYRSGQVENATAKFVHYIILVDDDPRASVVNIVSEVKKMYHSITNIKCFLNMLGLYSRQPRRKLPVTLRDKQIRLKFLQKFE